MSQKKSYSIDSVTRALVHHGARFDRIDEGRKVFRIHTFGVGSLDLTLRETYHYVVGLADKERLVAKAQEEVS